MEAGLTVLISLTFRGGRLRLARCWGAGKRIALAGRADATPSLSAEPALSPQHRAAIG